MAGLVMLAPPAIAQPSAAGAPAADTAAGAESQNEELARRSTDPTASPPSFGFISDITLDYRTRADGTSIDETGRALRFQPVLPFSAWGTSHILRMTMPYQAAGPGPEGLGDLTIFDLLIVPRSWGRLGVGLVTSFAAATSDVPAHARVGPAVGAVIPVSKKLNLGLFNQNLFATETAISQIQPIAAHQLGSGWSLSLGDLQWIYDWNQDELVSMPLGIQLGKVQPLARQPMRFAVNPQVDLKDLPGNGQFKISITVTLLLPEGKR